MDNYLSLNAQEEKRFQAAINELPDEEREATMEITTSWFEQGLEQGFERERELVLRQLELQVGTLSKRAQAGVKRLSKEQLESLGVALLNFTDARDLTKWLREHSLNNKKSAA